MKKWKKEIIISAPIEFTWSFFYGNLERKKMIFPKVVDEQIMEQTEQIVGTVIRQMTQNGSFIEHYDLTIKKLEDERIYKTIQESFLLNNRFRMTITYELESQNDKTTKFIYTSINKPKNVLLNVFQWFGNDEVIVRFMERTKEVIEHAYKDNNDLL